MAFDDLVAPGPRARSHRRPDRAARAWSTRSSASRCCEYLGYRVQTAHQPGPHARARELGAEAGRTRGTSARTGDLALALEGAARHAARRATPHHGFWQQQFLNQWGDPHRRRHRRGAAQRHRRAGARPARASRAPTRTSRSASWHACRPVRFGDRMHLDYTPEQQALRKELRAYFAELLTAEVRAELGDAGRGRARRSATLVRQMGADGWLGVGWPKEYGGQGRAADRPVHLLRRGAARRRAVPVRHPQHRRPDAHALRHRRAEAALPARHPRAARSTSPSATPSPRPAPTSRRCAPAPCATATSTSSTATRSSPAAPTRPTTSGSPCRTDPDAPKHKGISIILVPDRRRPGSRRRRSSPSAASSRPRPTTTTCGCRWPTVVGEENAGWQLITTQLNHERVGLAALGGLAHRLCDDVVEWCRATDAGAGRTMIDLPWVQLDLARSARPARGDEAAQLAHGERGRRRRAEPGRRVGGEGVRHRDARSRCTALLLGILGAVGLPARRARPARCSRGEVERAARAAQINTFGGGVNEVQREIVATVGPRHDAAGAMTDDVTTPTRALLEQLKAFEGARRRRRRVGPRPGEPADDPPLGRGDRRRRTRSTSTPTRPRASVHGGSSPRR